MKNNNYVICRDDLYIGTVIKTNKKNIIIDDKSHRLRVFSFNEYRNILFTPNEIGLAEDLMYASPEYPILNITDTRLFFGYKDDITLIHDIYNLGNLLDYLGYGMYLSYKDIIKIRKTLFNGKFISQNPELFGWQELNFEDFVFYKDGIPITDKKEIDKRKWQFILDKSKNNIFQTSIRYNEQLKEFESILESKSDNSIFEAFFGNKVKANNFTPVREEGKIKKIGTIY